MLSFQGPRTAYKDSVTFWPLPYLGFSGTGVGWEMTTVGLHLAAPEVYLESMFHSVLGKQRGRSRFGDQYEWVCALLTVMEEAWCVYVIMRERMNSCLVEGLESLNSLPYSLTAYTSVSSSVKWVSLRRD